MIRNYYIRFFILILAFATSQIIVLFAYRSYQGSSIHDDFVVSSLSQKTGVLDERINKERIALDVENEKNIADNFNNQIDDNSIIFIDDLPEEKVLHQIDYTKSHPFENQCRFPVLLHNDEDISKHVNHYREIDCTNHTRQPPLVNQLRNGEILIGRPHRSSVSEFECFYMEISGTLAPNKTKIIIGKEKKLPLSRRILIQKDQFIIKCYSKKEEVYHNVFAWIPTKPVLSPPATNIPNKYSVALLIIDSTSRNQFYRHMPLTLKFMKEKDFQILHGYTKVGDNSAINLLGILSGMIYDKKGRGFTNLVANDSVFDFKKYDKDFSKLPETIVARARKGGCATMWNDDVSSSGYGIFHYYDFKGFQKPIADYYFRPFYEYQYQKLKANTACSNGENIIPKFLNLWEEFSKKFANQCHFSFNFFTTLTHASANNLELYDRHLIEALERMELKGGLENTFLFIMGDHGQRISPIQKTYVGRVEERMSMMGIHVPKKFREEYPEKFNNLVINKNRLTSNYDVHETLEDIFDLTLGTQHKHNKNHGFSLFDKIPKNRTCQEAMIPENFCCCMDKIEDKRLKAIEPLIEPKLKDYLITAFKQPCITNYTYKIIKQPKSVYTISPQVRFGIRYPRELTKMTKAKIPKYLLEIEFEVGINVTSNSHLSTQGTLLVRMQYNFNTKYLQLNASPLLKMKKCPNFFIIENICGCFDK